MANVGFFFQKRVKNVCFLLFVYNYIYVDKVKFSKTLRTRISFFFLFLMNFFRHVEVFFLGGEECLCCGKNSGIIPVCKICLQKLFVADGDRRCSVCGKTLVSEIELCSSCRSQKILFSVDSSFSLFSYRLWKKKLLFAWKTEEKRVLSSVFASFAFKKIAEISKFWNSKGLILPVVPVPPRPGKIRQKGWDQIDELCFYLRNLYGIETLPFLRRLTRFQQKKLNRLHRLEQIKNAFVLRPQKEIQKLLKSLPETVILLDDVMTTGSTLEACAFELKKAGIKNVIALTLFIVD